MVSRIKACSMEEKRCEATDEPSDDVVAVVAVEKSVCVANLEMVPVIDCEDAGWSMPGHADVKHWE